MSLNPARHCLHARVCACARARLFVALALLAAFLCPANAAEITAPAAPLPQDNPRLTAQPIVFVTRHQYRQGHHNTETFFPSTQGEFNSNRFTPGGTLKIIDFKTGKVTTLLATDTGVIRDPEVHFDGKKILFSMRKDTADSYHIYEINADGTGLKQLTFVKDADDIDPFYLADDHIAFSSTREPKYCGCNRHIMANLYRMEPDGANIYQISKNTLFDGHGALLPDGRILYDRWEYVDRNYGDAQGLWTCNPDGTNHALYWGNNTPSPGAVIDARPIPGTDKTVCIFSSCHDRPWGALAVIDRKLGLEGPTPVVNLRPADARQHVWESDHSPHFGIDNMRKLPRKYEDPYPLDERYVLCVRQLGDAKQREKTGIYLVDTAGGDDAENLLYSEERLGCFDPVPLAPHRRPPVLPVRRDFTSPTGTFYILDVYNGTHLQGIQRGDVRSLRVVEVPEKRFWTPARWSGQGTVYPAISWDDFNTKKVLGTVPVHEDGSAHFEVPAEKFVYFQLLDKDGVMLQSMRSGTYVQPGEQNGCIGCHDDRLAAVTTRNNLAQTLRRPPSKLQPRTASAREFSYREEVQPIWDKYCVTCHHPGKPAGKKLNLTGGTGQAFNPSYAELWAKHYIAPVGAGPARFLQPRTWGASASKLYNVVKKRHGGVQLDAESLEKIITWIDLNAPYYPSYATSYPANPYGRSPLTTAETRKLQQLTGQEIAPNPPDYIGTDPAFSRSFVQRETAMLRAAKNLNFDEPEKSPVLVGLAKKSPEKYAAALEIIRLGKERIRQNGSNEFWGFKYCATDEWREKKYQETRLREQANRRSILAGEKRYDKAE